MGKSGFECIVSNCYNSTTNKIVKFHSLPKDEELRMIWLTNCNRLDLSEKTSHSLCKSYRVCGDHFEKKMYFTDRLLLHRAVPTIFTMATDSITATSPTVTTTSNILCSTPIIARKLVYPESSSTPIVSNTNSISDSVDLDVTVTQSETEELDIHMKTLRKKDENIYAKFKDKSTSMMNKITSIQNPEHLKEAMQKLEALDAFIDVTSRETTTSTEFINLNSDPPNKKIITQNNFYSTKNKKRKIENDLTKPSTLETRDLSDLLLNKKFNVLKQQDVEHSYYKQH